jgi:hypothetical protein
MRTKKKIDCYTECLSILTKLKEAHPNYTLSMHLATALSDYGDVWGLPDKELLFALDKYYSLLELDREPEDSLEKIIEEGKHLDTMFKDEENQEEEYGY